MALLPYGNRDINFYINAQIITSEKTALTTSTYHDKRFSNSGMRKFLGNKNIITNFYRIKVCNSIICEYLCIGFIDFMPDNKKLSDFTNLFSQNSYFDNDKIILEYFQ